MSIKEYMNELETLNKEIKRISLELRELKKQKVIVEQNVADYLIERNLPGFKYKDTHILLQEKQVRPAKNIKKKKEDILTILKSIERSGNFPPEEVLNDILEVSKGSPKKKTFIKIQKIKE